MLIAPNTLAETGLSQFQILANKQSAHTAYASARAKPRVLVTPQVLPGPGYVVGVNYLFQAFYPEGENLTWTVSRQSNFVVDPSDLSGGLGDPLALAEASTVISENIAKGALIKTGNTDTFTFRPSEVGRYTVKLNFRQDDVGFFDTLVVHANASSQSVSRHVLIAIACIAASATIVIVTAVVCAVLLHSKQYAIETKTVQK